MKSKFNFLVVLFTFAVFIANAGIEKTKEFNESWAVSDVETLSVFNKFGEVLINNDGGSEVTIDVVVTVESSSENRAEKLLELIDVEFSKIGKTVKAVTSIEKSFKNQMKFSIDYTVNIPPDKNLEIENKFGNTVVNKLNANGTFDIKYGNLTANSLNGGDQGDINISLGYGKATIESLSEATIEIKYSKIHITQASDINVESKYSVLEFEEINSIITGSKYDTYNLEEVGSIKATSKYSHFKIEEVKKSLNIDSEYGGIKVGQVSDNFESINIDNTYGTVSLGIGDHVSYEINADCDYCDIKYDEDNFKGNRMSENHSKKIDGKIGTANTSAKVVVSSRYGDIKLR